METTTTGDTVARNDQLLLVLQEIQRSLKRLEDHLSAQSNEASRTPKELENDRDEGDTSSRKVQVHEEDPVKNIMHPIVKLNDKLIDPRHQNTSSVLAMSIENDGSSDAVSTETLPRSHREETPKDDPISDSNDLDVTSSLDPKDLNLSNEPSEPIVPTPNLPPSTWCLLKANTLPYDDSLGWRKVRVRDNVLDPVVTSPQDWEDLKRDDGLSYWQYCRCIIASVSI